MVSQKLQTSMFLVLSGQCAVAILNSLFLLGDGSSAALAMIGIYGVIVVHQQPRILFVFIGLQLLSVLMDIAKLTIWTPYVLVGLLDTPSALGAYFLSLTVVTMVIKLVSTIFAGILRHEAIKQRRDPSTQSTVHGVGFMNSWGAAAEPGSPERREVEPLLGGDERSVETRIVSPRADAVTGYSSFGRLDE